MDDKSAVMASRTGAGGPRPLEHGAGLRGRGRARLRAIRDRAMSDPVAAALRELRREYHAEGPARVAELEAALAALRAGEESAETTLACSVIAWRARAAPTDFRRSA